MDWFPHKTIRFCGGPGLNSNGQAKPAHFKVLSSGQNACTLYLQRVWTVLFAGLT